MVFKRQKSKHNIREGEPLEQYLLGPIGKVSKEARAKIAHHDQQLKSCSNSFATETASNILFIIAAYKLNLPNIEHALLGAMLVYAPLAAQFKTASDQRSKLTEKINLYIKTRDTRVFDSVGLTFRGNRNFIEDEEQKPFIGTAIREFFDPAIITPKNDFGLIGSAAKWFYYSAYDNAQIAIIRPVQKIRAKLSERFGKSAGKERPFVYTKDPCDNSDTTVIRTHLPEINPDAIVQMPAHKDRLKKSLIYTQRSIRGDYAKMIVNTVGIAGAAEFCYTLGSDIWPRLERAIETNDPSQAGVAATWLLIAHIGAGPLKHFLDEAAHIHHNVKTKFSVADVKKQALNKLLETEKLIEKTIEDFAGEEKYGDCESQDLNLKSLEYLTRRIDVTSLSQEAQAFLVEHEVLSQSDVYEEPVQAEMDLKAPTAPTVDERNISDPS